MENHQRKLIQENRVELIKLIQCSTMLLTILAQDGIFSTSDTEDIMSRKKPSDKVAKLLDIIEQRSNSFEKFISALGKEKQSGAVEILKVGLQPEANCVQDQKKEIPQFCRLPRGLEWLHDHKTEAKNIVLEAFDPPIAIQRIKDACSNGNIEFVDTSTLTSTDTLVEEVLKLDLKGFLGKVNNHNVLIIPKKLYKITKLPHGWKKVDGGIYWRDFSKYGQDLLLEKK